MAPKPNPYVKAVTASNPPKVAKAPKPKKQPAPAPAASSSSAGKVKAGGVDAAVLKQQILDLGGDEADLKMLIDAGESESEMEDEDEKVQDEAALSKELKSLFKTLDFAAVGGAQVDDDDDEEEEEEDSDEEDDSEEDSEEDDEDEDESEEEVAPAPAPAKAEVVETKFQREERRKAEREAIKAQLDAEKALIVKEKPEIKLPKIKSDWIVDPTPQWYAFPLPKLDTVERPPPATIGTLHTRATALLEKENATYAASLTPSRNPSAAPPPPNGLSKADQVFIQQILTSGTSSDKVSALLLLVSSSPLHTTAYLDQLATLCKKKSRDESGRAVRGVVEWWRGDSGAGGGSPSRKLRAFADQPGLGAISQALRELEGKFKSTQSGITKEEIEQCLLIWAFEDWLKKWFFGILQALESMSVDPLPHPRSLAIVHLSNILRDKPEQEANILRLLVNKIGDSQRAIASKTSHLLLQILQVHPGMTPIMVREVSALILRPPMAAAPAAAASGSHKRFGDDDKKGAQAKPKSKDTGHEHARYYGVITLNQVMLNRSQAEVAGKMIEVYFEIFGDILGRVKDEEKSKGEGKGAQLELTAEEKPKAEKRKFVKGGKGKKGQDEVDDEPEVNETDSKLVAAVLTGVNRAFPFAKLEEASFQQRLDTLFRITHTGTFNVSIQALMLIFHVSASKRQVSDRFYRALYASLYDPRLVGSSKQALYLNLVFKAVKQDSDKNRVMAIVKRLVQIMLAMDVTFILGSIWIVGELMATIPGLRRMITHPEDINTKLEAAQAAADPEVDPRPVTLESVTYDGKKREPQFAHAENSCLWELVPLLHHFHPSVVLHAEQLLSGRREATSSTEDLEQHSLNHFLDRFVYREGKKNAVTKGSSMMQSGVAGQDKTGRIIIKKGPARGEEALVNSDLFKAKLEAEVPVDQRFFHKYFSAKLATGDDRAKASKKRRKGPKDDSDESDADSIDDAVPDDVAMEGDLAEAMRNVKSDQEETDDEMEEAIWSEMKKTMPKEVGDSDVDLDDPSADESDDDEDLAQYDYTDSEEEKDGEEEEDAPFKSAFSDEEEIHDDGDDGFMEDEEDLLGSDEDMPMFLDGMGDDEDEEEEEEDQASSKKKSKKDERKQKKRKLNSLPAFASADDYAHLLGSDDEDNI